MLNKRDSIVVVTKEYLPVLVWFIILVLIKIVITLPISRGYTTGDELNYIEYSYQWFEQGSQKGFHYPYLYPVMIAVSFLFQDWYMATIILNCIYSSVSVLVVYFIAKMYVEKRESIFIMLLSTFLPYHWFISSYILSENLYLPIVLLTVYFCLRDRKTDKGQLIDDILLGFMLGCMMMTRFITLVTVPVFFVVWIMKKIEQGTALKKICLRAMLLILFSIAVKMPWIIINVRSGNGLKRILGFSIADSPNPEQLTIQRLVLFAIYYLAYFILIISPYLYSLFVSILHMKKDVLFCSYNRLWICVMGLTGAFLVAVTRHSWRVSYNYPEVKRIMGRYLIIVPTLIVILAMVSYFKTLKEKKSPSLLQFILLFSASLVLLFVSYNLIINGGFQEFTGVKLTDAFINWKGSMDGYRIKLLKSSYLLISFLMTAILIIVKKGIERHRCKWVFSILLCVFAFMQLSGFGKYYNMINNRAAKTSEFAVVLGSKMWDSVEDEINLYMDIDKELNHSVLKQSLQFAFPTKEINIVNEKNNNEELFVITNEKQCYEDAFMVDEFFWEKEYYVVYCING